MQPSRLVTTLLALAAGMAAMLPATVAAQSKPEPFPAKPITFINPLAAGGPQEVETRLYAQKIMENTGWKILVDFRVGAGGTLGQQYVVKAAPDGYTVLTTSSSDVLPRSTRVFPLHCS